MSNADKKIKFSYFQIFIAIIGTMMKYAFK